MSGAAFSVGELVWHKLFDYRGVVIDVDPVFMGTEEWYEQMAMSQPPKDQPWYHVLVDRSTATTYAAQKNLDLDIGHKPVAHPLLEHFFESFADG